MHLAVFGGTFDPPHNGHIALCLYARELLKIDKIIISVSNNPFKQNRSAADEHRKRMAELLSSEINRAGSCSQVSGWELEKKQPSFTVDLLRYIHEVYSKDRVTLLIGEDSFREFSSWKDYDQLFSLCDIAVFRRTSADINISPPETPLQRGNIKFIDFAYEVSSTAIRELIAAGQSISRFVPLSVHRYIIDNGLYSQH
ncbi:MAG: nicotinate (nicotinamide) nucleotide adenylyltransferase [Chlorobiales bacterium]|nr:nicotinate (nicotinamide) nucleotide adenylyltransferase [Chlorobiales bacterium]